ncbi:MAG: diguanylate cyclase/phosphodiesterase (GGDEF & EAL domains) with PAS/PAC sensor(s) [uncultured Blastococcus sp.]|uniref:Diguanylate cyclase/phosphodiesterase (GGDEF & EAL domains) with PAS/PAC sensor(S) n=1 Tax=uncultured Blastococcus sp. TaxID=217144 RepID=A0A6J4JMG9_9ACTN|nr:MAG: diguanylate cyclase/phosphodiesterase (GGDEF & EAL domains) with PAS/PAC sensor(s) [uncultured Blastococcus sp.]
MSRVQLTSAATGRRTAWSRCALIFTVAALALFATGVGPRPAGPGWAAVYDLGLYNAGYAGAAVICLLAVRAGADRLAWAALAVAIMLAIAGNLVYSLVIARMDEEPFPSIADLFYLLYYLPLYVALVALIRARVTRFHTSMWLDGVVGALGAGAVSVAVMLGPALELTEGSPAAVMTSLAYPIADVVLLALLVAVGAILGVRGDRTLLLLGAAILANLAGDIVYLDLATAGIYVEGGPLDLTWLIAVTLMGVAAHTRAPRPAEAVSASSSRVGWRVLAVPLACNVASLVVLGFDAGQRFNPAAAWLAVGCVLAALARMAVTFREVRAFNEVKEQARTDELTGLPNRRALFEQVNTVLSTATARRPAAMLLLDLDGFKEVNDSLGHHAGDHLLRQVGPRLRPALRTGDLLARLGGDEFAVLLPDAGLDEAQQLAERLRELLLKPITVEGIRLHIGVSIGVASAPVPAATVEELLRCADVAMYSAKAGRTGVHVYVPDPRGGSIDRLRTMEELRTALERDDELEVHLQPQVDLLDGAVIGAEALVRWRHPTRGLLSPAELLPAAEQAGLLRPLADRVLELSLSAAARWWPDREVAVSVNLSAANVTDLDLPGKVAQALLRHGLPARALTLELVEDTLMADPERGRTVLGELRRLGVRTSIDDYGTGYSSLAYLRNLPADELKLDRSLTHDVGVDPRAAKIVKHTVALAHDLGISVVAEGVEDDATGRVLRDLGCDIAQGYAIARPMPADDFLVWLATAHTFLLDGAAR